MRPGTELTLSIEKPAAGGRMLARHGGQVVLVAGTIPGERVRARVERVSSGVVFARTDTVDEPSPDRRTGGPDPACGGNDYAHIDYPRQLALKQAIIADAFARIAKHPLDVPVLAHGSPEQGYRMRARLHVHGARAGFYRGGTHDLCDAATSGQILPATGQTIAALERALADGRVGTGVSADIAENVPADERVLVLDLDGDRPEHGRWDGVLEIANATGLAVTRGGRLLASRGDLAVRDEVAAPGATGIRLARDVRGFFQGNRHLLQTLVERVLTHVPDGPLVDLYAGCGLFGLAHAAAGRGRVDAVESDQVSARDLRENATGLDDAVVHDMTVEAYLEVSGRLDGRTVLVDPPRTGLSRDAAARLDSCGAPRVVYLSCDVATLARDLRRLIGAGYRVRAVEMIDLFPATSHVETLVVADRIAAQD